MPEAQPLATLHTINKTATDKALNKRLSSVIAENDAVLLIEDGVYQMNMVSGGDSNAASEKHWSLIAKHIYVLSDDALARGIELQTSQSARISFITYEEFVNLTFTYQKVVSWY